jgi:hypothetical protein
MGPLSPFYYGERRFLKLVPKPRSLQRLVWKHSLSICPRRTPGIIDCIRALPFGVYISKKETPGDSMDVAGQLRDRGRTSLTSLFAQTRPANDQFPTGPSNSRPLQDPCFEEQRLQPGT